MRGNRQVSSHNKHDDLPEQAFYMVGTIEDARAQGEEMKKRGQS
ncbi:MAG TPA: hypothetical protein VI384_04735 [Candidatus Dormibacteraeota bacterium]